MTCHFYGCFSILGITLWQQSKIGNNFSQRKIVWGLLSH